MQLFILALVLAVFVHDAQLDSGLGISTMGWPVALGLVISHLVLAMLYTIVCRRTFRALGTKRTAAAMRHLDTMTLVYQLTVLALYCVGLWQGSLMTIRETVGDLVLLDEAAVLIVPLTMIAWGWWVYYPIDLRLREAPLIRKLDQGMPVAPVWTRGQFLISQLRHQVALMLVPLLALMGWVEGVNRWTDENWSIIGIDAQPMIVLAGSVVVFLMAPVVIRYLWDTVPLPPGELRNRLMAMCQQYRVGVRELLLWRTFGGLINGAVMGLIAPVRYILLTDALLEGLPRDRVEAVMAHELAHVKRRHMFWLVVAAVATLGTTVILVSIVVRLVAESSQVSGWPNAIAVIIAEPALQALAVIVLTAAIWIVVFGWVSRQFERQADTFAVKHTVTYNRLKTSPDEHLAFDERSITVMTDALQRVADLNNIPTRRHSWRHGSIYWRQAYLRSLRGRPIENLPIDRLVYWINIVSGITLAGLLMLRWVSPRWFGPVWSALA